MVGPAGPWTNEIIESTLYTVKLLNAVTTILLAMLNRSLYLSVLHLSLYLSVLHLVVEIVNNSKHTL